MSHDMETVMHCVDTSPKVDYRGKQQAKKTVPSPQSTSTGEEQQAKKTVLSPHPHRGNSRPRRQSSPYPKGEPAGPEDRAKSTPTGGETAGQEDSPKSTGGRNSRPRSQTQVHNHRGGRSTGGRNGRSRWEHLHLHLERLGVGSCTAQAPTCVWTSHLPGRLAMHQTAHKFPSVALQICCFPRGPESREGVALPGAGDDLCSGLQLRSEQWTDVWPPFKNTVWNGDDVLIHCISVPGSIDELFWQCGLANKELLVRSRSLSDAGRG